VAWLDARAIEDSGFLVDNVGAAPGRRAKGTEVSRRLM